MKTLITGATGFLGRRLVAELAPRHQLRVLVRPQQGHAAPLAAGSVVALRPDCERIEIAATRVPRFTAGSGLKSAVKGR